MKKLFILYLCLILSLLSVLNCHAIWNDIPDSLKDPYNLNQSIRGGDTFKTISNPYRGGRLSCSYKVSSFLFWKTFTASVNCYSNTGSSKAVITFFSGEYSYSLVSPKDSTSASFSHSASRSSVPFGVQYYFEYDNDGPGHDTHVLYYRIYNA